MVNSAYSEFKMCDRSDASSTDLKAEREGDLTMMADSCRRKAVPRPTTMCMIGMRGLLKKSPGGEASGVGYAEIAEEVIQLSEQKTSMLRVSARSELNWERMLNVHVVQ